MKYKVSHKKYSVDTVLTRKIQNTLKEHPTWKVILYEDHIGWGNDWPVTCAHFYKPEEWDDLNKAYAKWFEDCRRKKG